MSISKRTFLYHFTLDLGNGCGTLSRMDPYDELRKLEQEIEAAIAEIDAILGRKPGMITIPPMAVVNYGDGETFPAFTVIADYREERTIIHKGPCPKRVYRPHDSWNTLDCEATLEDA